MKNNDNPFLKLAKQLAYFFPGGPSAGLNGVSKAFGGLWGLYGYDIWPENMPPLNPPRRLSFVATFPKPSKVTKKLNFWQRLLRFIKSLLNWNNQEVEPQNDIEPRQAVAAKHQPQPEELADSLAECHDWLCKKNFQHLSSWFAPFWEEIPLSEFAVVSEKSLAWRLVTEQGTLSNKTALDEKYRLDAGATLGDLLSMHLYIEELIIQAQPHLNIEPTQKPKYQKQGGLRTASFLNTYLALTLSGAKKWLNKINMLIENSPITQIVYIDVIEKAPSQDIFKFFTELGSDIKSWHDLWISHLAKSLVGGILSPPPVFEQYQRAKEEYEQLEVQINPYRKIPPYLRSKLNKAKEKFEQLRSQMVYQYFDRLNRLADILRDTPYLHLRVLDMLLKHIVSSSIEPVQNLRRQQKLLPPQVRPKLLLVCFQIFESILFGRENWAEFIKNQEEQSDKLRDSLRFLLQPPLPKNPVDSLSRQAGVPASSIKGLLTQFMDNNIKVPFRQVEHLGKAPVTVFGEWFIKLSDRLPINKVSVKERVIYS